MMNGSPPQVYLPSVGDLVVLSIDPVASVAHLENTARTQQMKTVVAEHYLAFVALVRLNAPLMSLFVC